MRRVPSLPACHLPVFEDDGVYPLLMSVKYDIGPVLTDIVTMAVVSPSFEGA